MSRQTLLQKNEKTEEIKRLSQQYKALGVASLEKVRSAQLQELRRRLEKSALLLVNKNSLMRKAIAELKGGPEIEKLEGYLTGSNIFLFTNLNPFKLEFLLRKNKVKTTAKAGDKAAYDVVIPAGNTGLPPGPIISQLNAVGLPTRIETGSVWVNRDTVVVREGETISEKLANVLSKLAIKPVEVGLTMKVVYDDGIVITGEQLQIDLKDVRLSLEEAHALAFNLSIEAAYPSTENISSLLKTAHQRAHNVALNAGIPTSETIADLLRRSYMEMIGLSNRLAAIDNKAAPTELL